MNQIENALSRTTDTKALEIGSGAVKKTPLIFNRLFPGAKALVIADTNTWKAAGNLVQSLLESGGITVESPFIISDPNLYAEWSYMEAVENALKVSDAVPVAVGSGVINDLTKLASFRLGRRYVCVGTAASMDGYTAYGASITFKGNKRTFDCPAPLGFVMDSSIAAAAPYKMSASGYADLIAKIPAGTDWIIAECAGIEKINSFAFDVVQKGLKNALSDPAAIRAGDEAEVEKLAEGLLLSGFAMQACQNSRPASGIEHQFSHLWDMEHLTFSGKSVSHGFKVGIGTLVSTAFLELLLEEDIPAVNEDSCAEKWKSFEDTQKDIVDAFNGDAEFVERCTAETRNKYTDAEGLRKQIALLKSNWPHLKERISEQIIPFGSVKKRLELVGAPTEPEQIGISRKRLLKSCKVIPYMRSRFSSVDVAVRIGIFDKWLDKLFGKGGIWEI